jgi:nucleotide-binding universal stress UspA family protein
MTRILLAAEDSSAGLAAARTAIRLAAEMKGPLLAVHVLADGVVERALVHHPGSVDVPGRRDAAAAAVLRHVDALAEQAGVSVETLALHGHAATCILEEARAWRAEVIVMGRQGSGRLGRPYVGSEVRHVLEFATVPVLVVPPPSRGAQKE